MDDFEDTGLEGFGEREREAYYARMERNTIHRATVHLDANLYTALWRICRGAQCDNPYDIALRAELARLYDAAGERRPDALGLPREDGTQYVITENTLKLGD